MARKVIPPVQLSDESQFLYDAINKEPPLARVLIVGAFLEKALVSLLGNFLVHGDTTDGMLKESGPLGEFSRCAKMAYCLGLISKGMLENLGRIGAIRNLFAHSHLPLDFTDSTILKLCGELKPVKVRQSTSPGGKSFEQLMHDPVKRFCVTAVFMFNTLIAAARATTPRPKMSDFWD